MPRREKVSPVSSDVGGYSDEDDDFFIVKEGDDFTKWDPNNNQHAYRPPGTSQSISTTIRHSWTDPSVGSVSNAAVDIAKGRGPRVGEGVGKAAGWLSAAAKKLSGQSSNAGVGGQSIARVWTEDTGSDREWRSAPKAHSMGKRKGNASLSRNDSEDHGWRPDPNAFNTVHIQAPKSREEIKGLKRRESERRHEATCKSSLARKNDKERLEAEGSRAGSSARRREASDALHPHRQHANETQTERRARIKAEWDKKPRHRGFF